MRSSLDTSEAISEIQVNLIFGGYFDPDFFFLMIEINNTQGDLTDISAKKAPLIDTMQICVAECLVNLIFKFRSTPIYRIHSFMTPLKAPTITSPSGDTSSTERLVISSA